MAQRNYACDKYLLCYRRLLTFSSIVEVYFGAQKDIDQVGELVFKKQLYYCMLGQALEMKSNIETRRSTNEFGTVIWQVVPVRSIAAHVCQHS